MHLSVFDRKVKKKKKTSDFRSVAVSSWLHRQLSSSAVTRVCVYLCVCVDRVQTALRETVMGQLSAALYCCCKHTKHTAWPSSWPRAPSLWPCPLSLSHSFCFSCSPFVLITAALLTVSSLHLLPLKKVPTSLLLSFWEHTHGKVLKVKIPFKCIQVIPKIEISDRETRKKERKKNTFSLVLAIFTLH